jgi:hypothetical protein
MRMIAGVTMTVLALLASGAQAHGQEAAGETCKPALMKDILSMMSTDQQKYSFFSQIDERSYEQLKSDMSAGISIPIVGDMLGLLTGSANYSQFTERRREFFQRIGYNQETARELRDLRVVTSPVAYQAWSRCMEAFARERQALVIFKDREDANTVHVRIRNSLPVDVKLYSDLLNGRVTGQAEGKAFRDGVKLNAAGTRPVLIQRVGAEPLKLSIRTNPPIDGLFIDSEWSTAPSGQLRGALTLAFESTHLEERGQKRGDTWITPDLHERRCRAQPCAGIWQLAHSPALTVTAAAGRKVRNPRIICDVDNRGACAWANEAANARCTVEEGGRRALCTATTGSRSHRIVAIADEYELVVDQTPPTEMPVLLFSGGQFQLRVPTHAKTAHFDYQTPEGSGGFTPGDPASPDGRFVLIGHEDTLEARYFTYRMQ